MPTIKEVSELAGVSLATVSRVMNGSDRVREATKKRVRVAMETLGYMPNSAAQSLASNRTNTLGMVVSWLDGPFYGPAMSAVEQTLRQQNKHVIIVSGHETEQHEIEAVQFLKARQVDGLILLTESLDKEYLQTLSKDFPIYLINRQYQGLEDRNMWLDNELGGYEATRYLLDQGHRELICIAGQVFKQDAQDRVRGFKRALQEAGLSVSDDQVKHTRFDIPGGVAAISALDARGLNYTAVVAGSDEMAIGAMEWLRQRGRNVPEDVSVIGFDDQVVADFVTPKLTTMRYPVYEMAKACANMAVREIYNKIPATGLQFSPSLVVRQSVAPPPRR